MNKLLIHLLTIAIIIFSSCNRKNKIKINGCIEDRRGTKVYIQESYIGSSGYIDSIKIKKNGNFSCKIRSEKPMFLELSIYKKNILILAHPGERININLPNIDPSTSYTISGSKDSKNIKFLNEKLNETKHIIDSLENIYFSNISDDKKKHIETQINTILSNHKKFIIYYVLQDLKSLTNIVALYQKLGENKYIMDTYKDIQYFKIVNDSLKKHYPMLPCVKSLNSTTTTLINNYNQTRLLSQVKKIKSTIPDIRLPDLKKDTTALSSLKGKMVLLYFWSPSIKDNIVLTRQLITIYNQYKTKGFEIYQVAFAPDLEKWKNIVKFEEIPWINVCDNQGIHSTYLAVYNVTKFPTTYLIDKTQKEILGKNLLLKQLDLKLNYLLNN